MLSIHQNLHTTHIDVEFSNGLKMCFLLRKHEEGRESYRFRIVDKKGDCLISGNGNYFNPDVMEEVLEYAVQAMYYDTEKFTGW